MPKNNVIEIFADMYDSPALMGNTLLQDDAKLFQITFDWRPDGEGGGEFNIKQFRLHTNIQKAYKNTHVEWVIDMPKESFYFAEKLLWNKVKMDDSFIENLEHPEYSTCGHDLSLT